MNIKFWIKKCFFLVPLIFRCYFFWPALWRLWSSSFFQKFWILNFFFKFYFNSVRNSDSIFIQNDIRISDSEVLIQNAGWTSDDRFHRLPVTSVQPDRITVTVMEAHKNHSRKREFGNWICRKFPPETTESSIIEFRPVFWMPTRLSIT